jgi:hypothetical protein
MDYTFGDWLRIGFPLGVGLAFGWTVVRVGFRLSWMILSVTVEATVASTEGLVSRFWSGLRHPSGPGPDG